MKRLLVLVALIGGSFMAAPHDAKACGPAARLVGRTVVAAATAPVRLIRALRPEACGCLRYRRIEFQRRFRLVRPFGCHVERSVVVRRTFVR